MGKRRNSFIYGSAMGAAVGVVLAPRLGESRRAALTRLRLSLRPGRGSLSAFAGTPCSQAGPTSAEAEHGPARD
ncbi:MAG TPA: hypothetical protein VIL79_10465 [Thermoleophilia bacterium]